MKENDLKKHLNPSLYKILFIDRSAPPGIIKSSYRELCKTEHPDKSKEAPEVANKKFLLIKTAYDVLSNPALKGQYDILLENHIKQNNAKLIEAEIAKKSKPADNFEVKAGAYPKGLQKEITESLKEGLESIRKFRKDNNI